MSDFTEAVWLFSSNKRSRGLVRQNIAEGALLWRYAQAASVGILEIGTKHGGSAALMSLANPKVSITSVDLSPVGACGKFLVDRNVHLITANSRSVSLASKSFDLVFVDGDHSYEGVRADWENLRPSLVEGAVVLFHDAAPGVVGTCKGVGQLVAELVEQKQIEVLEVVDTMVAAKVMA